MPPPVAAVMIAGQGAMTVVPVGTTAAHAVAVVDEIAVRGEIEY